MRNLLLHVALLLFGALLPVSAPLAQQTTYCNFASSSQLGMRTMIISLPSSLSIPSNATNGTPLWDSGWSESSSNEVLCSRAGRMQGTHAAGIGAAIPGYNSSASGSGRGANVFATNVPGIGVSVFWCNQPLTCVTDPAQIMPLLSVNWVLPISSILRSQHRWRVRLIKIDTINASAGAVTVGGTSIVKYGDLPVVALTITGSSQVGGQGSCEMNADSRSIDVPLPDVSRADFVNSPIPLGNDKAKTFNINMLCDRGVKVSYQVQGVVQSSGNVLANSTAQGMASGVGVTLFQGDKSSTTQLQLGSKYLYSTTTANNTQVKIPLTARYMSTAGSSAVGAGLVSTMAYFIVYYE